MFLRPGAGISSLEESGFLSARKGEHELCQSWNQQNLQLHEAHYAIVQLGMIASSKRGSLQIPARRRQLFNVHRERAQLQTPVSRLMNGSEHRAIVPGVQQHSPISVVPTQQRGPKHCQKLQHENRMQHIACPRRIEQWGGMPIHYSILV